MEECHPNLNRSQIFSSSSFFFSFFFLLFLYLQFFLLLLTSFFFHPIHFLFYLRSKQNYLALLQVNQYWQPRKEHVESVCNMISAVLWRWIERCPDQFSALQHSPQHQLSGIFLNEIFEYVVRRHIFI